MNMKKLSSRFFVAGQITISDLGAASAQGIKTIINNRPDNEVQGQPESADLQRAAKDMGMHYVNLPVVAGSITDQNIDDLEDGLREVRAPILAFCRTGTRSASLWALSEARTLSVDAVLAAANEAGYDLTAMRDRLARRADGAAGKPEKTRSERS